jgi:hypothetical protein
MRGQLKRGQQLFIGKVSNKKMGMVKRADMLPCKMGVFRK